MTTDLTVGYDTLGADINKAHGQNTLEKKEGIVSAKLPELTLEMEDEEIVKLTEKWEKSWQDSTARAEWEKQCKENEEYWLGKQFDGPRADKGRPQVDNVIFEALETYLPQATRRNPDPIVKIDESEKDENGNTDPVKEKYATKVKLKLADLADKNKLRLKLKKGARHWSLYLIGIAKMGWDLDRNIPSSKIVRPQKLILDPEAMNDEDGYSGDRIGEYRKMTASKLLTIIGEGEGTAEARKAITEAVKDDLATEIQFIEWWTPQYFCWKLGKTILLKKKNPHWNYDSVEQNEQVDDYGNATTTEEEVQGINHFEVPKMPYEFLVVFNLGDQPMDKTSLVGQNLANQDMVNKRNKQIDKNADDANGGMVVSLGRSGLTQAQAKGVTSALRKGGVVVIPDGAPEEAVKRYPAGALSPDIFNDRDDKRNRLRDIFGTSGSSAAGIKSEETVRGKIMARGVDTDRIGGGVSEYLEQFADNIYNWYVQLLYVYDTAFQFVPGAKPPKICVGVKEGSLLPKDSTSVANQAIELATAGKMATIDLYKRLEYPNPEELAANVWLETNAPQLLFKDNPLVQEAIMQQQAAAQQQAQAEAEKRASEGQAEAGTMERKHEQEMEKETMRAAAKAGMTGMEEGGGSILSQVPQNAVVA